MHKEVHSSSGALSAERQQCTKKCTVAQVHYQLRGNSAQRSVKVAQVRYQLRGNNAQRSVTVAQVRVSTKLCQTP